jgi:hypothetical protein
LQANKNANPTKAHYVKKDFLVLFALIVVASLIVTVPSCRKINDYTEVGGGLIPPIDNITTFDTSLLVQTYNDTFRLAGDSEVLTRSDEHFVGLITNDPIFGKTDARLFLELKNPYYGTYPFARKDSLSLDSVVLVLNYVETYGDSTIPQLFKVYEITNPSFAQDSNYLIRQEHFTYNTAQPLNEAPFHFIVPSTLNDSVKVFRDTTANQLRIRLDTNLARRFINMDTTNGFKNDSIFKTLFKGFAIRSEAGGNAVIGINVNSTNTKLAMYYRAPRTGGGGIDTAVTYMYFTPQSNAATYVKRDYSGTPVAAAAGLPIEAPIGYVQKEPGTYVNVKVPALATLSNRIVHRAELIVEELWDPSDATFPPPDHLYLDASDPTITSNYKFRSIPWSLDISAASGFDFVTFGTTPTTEKDAAGHDIKVWKFNISRYLQHVVNGTERAFDFRLYAPLTVRGRTRIQGSTVETDVYPSTYVNGSIVTGRVRVGGGNHPTQRMRLRIIYSKL